MWKKSYFLHFVGTKLEVFTRNLHRFYIELLGDDAKMVFFRALDIKTFIPSIIAYIITDKMITLPKYSTTSPQLRGIALINSSVPAVRLRNIGRFRAPAPELIRVIRAKYATASG